MDAAIWMGWTSCASMGCWHSCYQQWHCQKANPEGIKREQRSAADNVTPYLEVLLFFFFLYLFRGLSSPPSYWQWAAGCEHVIIQLMLALVSRDTTGGGKLQLSINNMCLHSSATDLKQQQKLWPLSTLSTEWLSVGGGGGGAVNKSLILRVLLNHERYRC